MELKDAIAIVSALAEGVDPYSGELFPEDSLYQHAQTVRALYAVLRAVEPLVKGDKPKKPMRDDLPAQAGKPWDESEDEQLTAAFEQGMSIKDLAASHGRTVGAIRSRLLKLGLLVDQAEAK